MTLLQIVSAVVLLGAFVLASVTQVNLGLVLLLSAAVIGPLGGVTLDTVTAGFPADTFVLIVGVCYFFAVVEASRTMDFIVTGLVRMLRGSVALVPWVFFVIASATTAVGTYPTAVAALVLPVAMRFAREYGVNRLLMALMVIHGILAGNYGPLATPALLVSQILGDAGLEPIPGALFLAHLSVNVVAGVIVFCLFGGLRLVRAGRVAAAPKVPVGVGGGSQPDAAGVDGPASHRPNPYQAATLLALVALLVLALGFGTDIGMTALGLGLLLTLVFARTQNTFVATMPWTVILMLAGVLVYVAVLTEIGTLAAVSDALAGLGSPSVGVLALSVLSGILSAFAASSAVVGANLALALPLVPDLGTFAVVGPITVSTTIVDASPLGVAGALALAGTEPESRPALLRGLFLWALAMVVVGPVVAWLSMTVL